MTICNVASIVFLMNLPFGFWRGSTKKLSTQWFFAIHLPIPIIIALRIKSGIGWQFKTFPIMIAAFFLGQFLGSCAYRWWMGRKHRSAKFRKNSF